MQKNIKNTNPKPEGFTLVELLVVMVIIGLLIGITVPAVSSFGATKIGTSAREVSGMLNVARGEAISKHTAVRFGVVTQSGKYPEFAFTRFGLWEWDKADREFKGVSELQSLPDGLIFVPDLPTYIRNADYATNDPSAIRGTYFLENDNAEFEVEIGGQPARVRFLEFRPSGSARIPIEHERRFLLILTEGEIEGRTVTYLGNEDPKNWALFATDHITGRTKIYRP